MRPVCVWWIGERDPERGMIDHVRLHLAKAFEAPVALVERPERPQDTLDPRRRQHASGRMLKFLAEHGPKDGSKVVGVTDQDLFIPILTFVFGEAQLGGAAAVVSTARLAEPAPRPDPRLFVERVVKECVHEVGHTMGLLHCGVPECAMGRAASVRDVDRKSSRLCGDCRALLREAASGGARP